MSVFDNDSAAAQLLSTVATQAKTIQSQAETIARLTAMLTGEESPAEATAYLDGAVRG